MQFITPSQDAGMQAYNSSGCKNDTALKRRWDTHSSAFSHQTKQIPPLRQAPNYCWGEGQ
jgi:hypothetical protein